MRLRQQNKWLIALLWATILFYCVTIPLAAIKDGDFIHLWVAGRTVATGQSDDLYTPETHYAILEETAELDAEQFWGERYDLLGVFFYPPFAGLFYAPFGYFSPLIAQGIHAAVTILLTITATYFLYQLSDQRISWVTIALLLFWYPATFYNFVLGQNGQLTLVLVLASWYFLKRNQTLLAGSFLSFLAYKPNWLLAIGWLPLIEKRWHVIGSMVLSGVGFTAVTALFLGIDPFFDYVDQFLAIANLHEQPNYPLASQYSTRALFWRWFGLTNSVNIAGWLFIILIWLISVWLIYRIQENRSSAFIKIAGLTWVTAVILNPHLHHYDLPLTGAAVILACTDWPKLIASKRLQLITLVIFHHLAFVLTDTFDLSSFLPLPTFATLAVWLWFAIDLYHHPQHTP